MTNTKKKKVIKFIFYYFVGLMGSFVTALNLSHLLPGNPDYQASWFNVGMALLIAVSMGWFAWVEGICHD